MTIHRFRAISTLGRCLVPLVLTPLALTALATLTGCAGVHASDAGDAPATLDADAREANVASFDYMWTTIRDKHWDPELGGIDWEAVRDSLRPRVETAETMAAARKVLNELIGTLGVSHFAVIPEEVYDVLDDPEACQEGVGQIGIDIRIVDDRPMVTRVRPGPAADAGVTAGWFITKVKDKDVAPVIAKIAESEAMSKHLDFYQAEAVMNRITGPVGEDVPITFLDGDDTERELSLTRVEPEGNAAKFGNLPTQYVRHEQRLIDGDIGYFAFNIWLDPMNVMKALEDALAGFGNAAGIIIDLRGNPGGIGGMAIGMAGWFIDQPAQYLGTMTMRNSSLKFVVNPRLEPYGGPVAILTDGLSASTSEIFAGGMHDLGRARIIGTRTMGAALPSVIEKLPNGDGFQYAFANYESAGGVVLEGNGIAPDIEVRPDRTVLLGGRDPVIDAAVGWIRSGGADDKG